MRFRLYLLWHFALSERIIATFLVYSSPGINKDLALNYRYKSKLNVDIKIHIHTSHLTLNIKNFMTLLFLIKIIYFFFSQLRINDFLNQITYLIFYLFLISRRYNLWI